MQHSAYCSQTLSPYHTPVPSGIYPRFTCIRYNLEVNYLTILIGFCFITHSAYLCKFNYIIPFCILTQPDIFLIHYIKGTTNAMPSTCIFFINLTLHKKDCTSSHGRWWYCRRVRDKQLSSPVIQTASP